MKFKIYQVPALRLNRNRILKVYWLADWPSDIWCASFNPVCFLWRQVDFWTQPSLEGAAVDIRLSPTNSYENITSLLTSYGIEFKLQIPNLQSVIDQQNGKQRERRKTSSWFDRYHTLDEVGATERGTDLKVI